MVTYPGIGPSIWDRKFRLRPGVVAPGGGAPCADASVAMKPAAEQIAQVATPAKPRLVNIMTSLLFGPSSSEFDGNRINLSVLVYPSQSEVFWQGARAADHGGGKRRGAINLDPQAFPTRADYLRWRLTCQRVFGKADYLRPPLIS